MVSLNFNSSFFIFLLLQTSMALIPADRTITSIETEEQFRLFLQEHPAAVVKFYTTWCPGCRAIEQPFETLANNGTFEKIGFASADLDKMNSVAITYTIETIPTIAYFDHEKLETKLNAPSLYEMEQEIYSRFPKMIPQAKETEGSLLKKVGTHVSTFFTKAWNGVCSFTTRTVNSIKKVFRRS